MGSKFLKNIKAIFKSIQVISKYRKGLKHFSFSHIYTLLTSTNLIYLL